MKLNSLVCGRKTTASKPHGWRKREVNCKDYSSLDKNKSMNWMWWFKLNFTSTWVSVIFHSGIDTDPMTLEDEAGQIWVMLHLACDDVDRWLALSSTRGKNHVPVIGLWSAQMKPLHSCKPVSVDDYANRCSVLTFACVVAWELALVAPLTWNRETNLMKQVLRRATGKYLHSCLDAKVQSGVMGHSYNGGH